MNSKQTVRASCGRKFATFPAATLAFAIQYFGGDVFPGDDMLGAEVKWMSMQNISALADIKVPDDLELFSKALQLFRMRHK